MSKLNRFFVSFAVLCLSVLLPASVHAADITVDPSCNLADAITAANSDAATGGCPAGNGADIITLTGNVTLAAALPVIESDITVAGNGYTISGNKQHQIFWVEESGVLAIQNATLADGRGVDDDDLYDEDLTIGGAIVNLGNITASNISFKNNSAVDYGGAIYSAQEASLIIRNSSFTNNSTTLNTGGAIHNLGKADVADSNFRNNVGRWSGGAIFNDAEISITNSIFTGNSTGWSGGAIYSARESITTISSSRFFRNSASVDGGAISNSGNANFNENSFESNVATEDGGAIRNFGSLIVADCAFDGNTATLNGGSIFLSGEATIIDSTFTNNFAAEDGGAILIRSGKTSISDSVFTGNAATDEGGAIRSTEYATARVSNSNFRENNAEDGGAIYSWGELSVGRSTFTGNSAAEEGGAIANHGTASIKDSILAENAGGDCHLGRKGELIESRQNHISDGTCKAT